MIVRALLHSHVCMAVFNAKDRKLRDYLKPMYLSFVPPCIIRRKAGAKPQHSKYAGKCSVHMIKCARAVRNIKSVSPAHTDIECLVGAALESKSVKAENVGTNISGDETALSSVTRRIFISVQLY